LLFIDDRLLDSFKNVDISDGNKETKKLSKSEKEQFRQECLQRHN